MNVSRATSASARVPMPCAFRQLEPRRTCKFVSPACAKTVLTRDDVIEFGL